MIGIRSALRSLPSCTLLRINTTKLIVQYTASWLGASRRTDPARERRRAVCLHLRRSAMSQRDRFTSDGAEEVVCPSRQAHVLALQAQKLVARLVLELDVVALRQSLADGPSWAMQL